MQVHLRLPFAAAIAAKLRWCLLIALAGGLVAAEPSWPLVDDTLQAVPVRTDTGSYQTDAATRFAMCRGIERTARGRLWAAWVRGGDDDTAYLVSATSDDDGATWSSLRFVIDPPDRSETILRRSRVGNFWSDPAGRLWFFHDQSMGRYDGRAGVWATVCENPDDDRPQWSPPRRLWHGSALNKPIVTRSGEWLLPVALWSRDKIRPDELRGEHTDLDAWRGARVLASSDRGRTWALRGGVVAEPPDFDEHTLTELADGRLWLLARTKAGMAESFSPDGGATWSAPAPSEIGHINSRFFVRRLQSGRLLLVKHGRIGERTAARSHLTAFLSDDDGRSWRGGLLIDERTGVSYPDGVQAADGMIYVVYDRNRSSDAEMLLARFTEDDVINGRFAGPRSAARITVTAARR